MKENADRARALDGAELAKQLKDSAEQMFRLRFQMSMGQMEGVKKYRSLRKERARMLTVIGERARGEATAPKAAPAAVVAQAKAKTKAVGDQKPAAAKPALTAKPKTVARKPAAAPRVSAKPVGAPKPRKQSSKG
jgi:large subunit ribosomal protein L29